MGGAGLLLGLLLGLLGLLGFLRARLWALSLRLVP
jgi:hypothetical protein